MNIFIAILGLAVLILIHEAGHFYVARAVGMRPRKFYIGFPPALVKTTRNGIEYGLGAIPLGGYVKIPGMHRPAPSDLDAHLGRGVHEAPELSGPVERMKATLAEGDLDTARANLPAFEEVVRGAELSSVARRSAERGLDDLRDALGTDAYWRQRAWKKVAVIFAGPAANLVLAVALFTALLMQGAWQIGVRLTAVDDTTVTTRVAAIVEESPAERAGLRPGDVIVRVEGDRVTTEELLDRIAGSEGEPLTLTVRRGGRERTMTLAAERREGRSLPSALEGSFVITGRVTKQIGLFFPRLVTGEGRKEVSSPIGITQASSEALEQGVDDYLFVLGLISLSLALLNLLPLLPLDGGHIAFSIIEGIRGRALGRPVYERVSLLGLVVVLFLFITGVTNDIGNLGG